MSALRKTLPPLPPRMRALPLDDRKYPIPYFVKWIDGKPDFRVLDEEKFIHCIASKLCSICGMQLGRFKSFVGGPMNVLQRISGEPPMHRDCAQFAVKACPFLLHPLAKRRSNNLPEDVGTNTVIFEEANPGITSIWTCTRFVQSGSGRTFTLLDCTSLEWFTEGREATADEIAEAKASAQIRLLKILKRQS